MTFRIDVKVNLLFLAISIILMFGAFFTYCIIFPLFERLLTFCGHVTLIMKVKVNRILLGINLDIICFDILVILCFLHCFSFVIF